MPSGALGGTLLDAFDDLFKSLDSPDQTIAFRDDLSVCSEFALQRRFRTAQLLGEMVALKDDRRVFMNGGAQR